MIINVDVNNFNFAISVGEGKQTFKWLASIIESRLRDQKKLRYYTGDDLLVTAIRNDNNELINPTDLIWEHVGSTAVTIHADTSATFPSDEWGNPIYDDWMIGQRVRSDLTSKWAADMDAWRERFGHGISAEGSGSLQSHFVQIGEALSQSDIDSAFKLDWHQMKWDWMTINFGDLAKQALHDMLESNYTIICQIFSHICGYGQVGERYGLSVSEFGHILHLSRLCNIESKYEYVEQVFSQPLSGRARTAPSRGPTPTPGTAPATGESRSSKVLPPTIMSRAHFAQSLLAVALDHFTDCTVADAMLELLCGPLQAFWASVQSTYMLYTSHDPVVRTSVKENYQIVKQAFLQCGTNDEERGFVFTLADFKRLLISASLVEPMTEHEAHCVRALLHAHLSPSRDWELRSMVFCEFLEAVATIALVVIENSATSHFSDAKKYRMALSMIADLQDSVHK